MKDDGNRFEPSNIFLKADIMVGARDMRGVENPNFITPSEHYNGAQGFGKVSLVNCLPLRGREK